MYFSKKDIRGSVWYALRETLLRPQQYFTHMPTTVSYSDSILLLIIIYLIPILILNLSMLFAFVFTNLLHILWNDLLDILRVLNVIMLVFLILPTIAWSVYFTWVSRVFLKKTIPPAEIFQVISYSNIPNALAWIPLFTPLLWLWVLYLSWHGLVNRYEIAPEAATLMVIAPLTLMFSAFIALLMFVGLSMSGNDTDLFEYILYYLKTYLINHHIIKQ